MKKYLPYFLIGLVVAAVVVLILTGRNRRERVLDKRISFRKRDKIPYGTFVAYHNLKYIFPNAAVFASRQEPPYWDSLSVYDADQALIIVCPAFNADKQEMKNLVRFIENGNDAFISAIDLSDEVTQMLDCDVNTNESIISYFSESAEFDTLTVTLVNPPFGAPSSYTYPGKRYDSYFSRLDSVTTTVLGHDENGRPDFIHLKAGKGNLYVHLAPMAFTNYFLLHQRNLSYYERVFSLISPATRKVVWDEYYISKKPGNEGRSNWLSAMLRYPSLRAGLVTALLILLLYALMEMRRKQRYIPLVKKPKNDSLDFVKTIGRLYHDKGDHTNLCRKMAAYFLEHVRNRYKLPTTELNDEFIRTLHTKTGVEEAEITGIVSFIRELDQPVAVSDRQLSAFHKQLELFYKKA